MPSRTAKAAHLTVANAIATGLGILTTSVLARLLPIADYAGYRQLIMGYHVALPLLSFGLPQSLAALLPGAGGRARAMVAHNLGLLGLGGCLTAAAIWMGADRLIAEQFNNPGLVGAVRLYAPYIALSIPLLASTQVFICQNQPAAASLYLVAPRLLAAVGCTVAALYAPTLESVVAALVFSAGVVLTPAVVQMLAAVPGEFSGLDAGLLRPQLSHAAPIALSTALVGLLAWLDKLLVAALQPAEEFAIYVSGAMELPLTAVPLAAMTVILPDLVRLWGRGEKQEAVELWKRAAVKASLVMFPAAVVSFALAPELMHVLFGDRYAASAGIFRILLLATPLKLAYFSTLFIAAGRPMWTVVSAAVGVMGVLVGVPPLLGRMGIEGAAWAAVAVPYLLQLPLALILCRHLYRIPGAFLYPWAALGKTAAVSLAASVPALGLRHLLADAPPLVVLATCGAAYGAAALLGFGWTCRLELGDFWHGLRRR